jgi:hypothetical protein
VRAGLLSHYGEKAWTKLVPSGSCVIEPIENLNHVMLYAFKEPWHTKDTERIFYF